MNVPPTRILLVAALLASSPLAIMGAAGLGSNPLEGYPEGSYVTPEGAIAVPLRAETPDDYTDEIHRKVLAAAELGLAYDVGKGEPVPIANQYLFIRPGAWMWSPSWCTMNFIYGTPGSYQIGSAGHCNAVNQVVTLVVYPGVFAAVGKTSVSHNNGVGDDYSLTTIYPQFQQYVDANVAVVGGPQGGAYTDSIYLNRAAAVKHFGHGTAIGTGGTPRAGYATFSLSTMREWYCFCAVIYGDSGGPILLAANATNPLGQGLGVITHLMVGGIYGTAAGTRLTVIPATIRNGDINPLPPA